MKKASLSKFVGGLLAAKQPAANLWHPSDRPYPRLADPASLDLAGREGLYAVWHLGVRPQWLRVGAASDLGGTLRALAQMPWIVSHQGNAGIYAAWAFPPANQYAGMVLYLTQTLKPAFQSATFGSDLALDPTAPAIVCPLPPGTQT